MLIFTLALEWGDAMQGSAFDLGVVAGYLAYATIHHGTHHRRADNAWMRQCKRWHAVHHHIDEPVGFGVTTSFWDHVFGTMPAGHRWISRDSQ